MEKKSLWKRYQIQTFSRCIYFFTLIMLIIYPFQANSQSIIHGYTIEQISTSDGLSQSSVYKILKDSQGFIWFGTQDGLNRYDGHQFKIFKRIADDPNSLRMNWLWELKEYPAGILWVGTGGGGLHKLNLKTLTSKNFLSDINNPQTITNNLVLSIAIDHKGTFWVGTNHGFNRFDPETEIFHQYPVERQSRSGLPTASIWDILINQKGEYWLGTTGGGLLKFDPQTEKFSQYKNDPNNNKSLSHNIIKSLYEDRSGVLWIGTAGGGLNRFHKGDGSFTRYTHDSNNHRSICNNIVNAVFEDPHGILWIGTDAGLNLFDRKTVSFLQFDPSIPLFDTLNISSIQSLCWDPCGVLWVGTHGDGVFKIRKKDKGFKHFKHIANNPKSLINNKVWSLHVDQSNNLWVGSSEGLSRYNEKKNEFTNYSHDPSDPKSLSNNQVMTILDIGDGYLWVGSYGGGVSIFDPQTEKFLHHYLANPNDPHSLSQNDVIKLYQDSSGILWVATYGGLNQWIKEKNHFISFQHNPEDSASISIDSVLTVYEDKNKNFFVGTFGGGLNRLNRATQNFIHCLNNNNDPYFLREEVVWDLFEDQSGTLWIGTSGGLKKFDKKNRRFKSYSLAEGLPNEVIYGILEDSNGYLWLSTINGLSRFNPKTEYFLNFNVSDGLQMNEFNMGAFCKREDGEMFFGGNNGFNSFFPEIIKINQLKPPLVLTNLLIFNKPVYVGEKVKGHIILDIDITRKREIQLTHQHSIFSLEYAGLHFIDPDQNQFAYKMEGLENDWNYVGNRRFASYSFIPPGKYKFRLKGANYDGIWNDEGISLKLFILPPFWKTWWFYSICILITLLTIIVIYRLRVQQLKNQEKRLIKMVHERTEELELANRNKNDFLARMSHEIRTPMNSILGFAELTLDLNINNELNEFASSIKKSGETLLILINEILDLSKIEGGQLSLESIDFDPEILAYNVCELMIPRIGEKPIEILCRIDEKLPANIKGDPSRFRQVLTNLMGNAIKFTDKGEIEISINVMEKSDSKLKLHAQVRDTGIGIPIEKQNVIFDAFQQADISDTRKYGGTGLGLAICKQIANAMQGDIWAESKPGKGSIFHFTSWMESSTKKTLKFGISKIATHDMEGRSALLVDDNLKSLEILEKMMRGFKFNIKTTTKGEDVLPQLINAIYTTKPYDLCIVDIHMPGMNGYDVAKQIREHSNKIIANTPIIALSSSFSRRSVNYQDVGFDAFLPKPIRREVLWKNIDQILDKEFLTVRSKKITPSQTQHSIAEKTKQSIRILMAEDNELNRKLVSFVLKKAGYHLEIVINGKEAIETFSSNPEKYDLILMDLQMPEMNGIDAAQIIRKKGFTQIPIIALTAASMKGDREKCIQAGMNDYISKPIKRKALYNVIRKWVVPNKK